MTKYIKEHIIECPIAGPLLISCAHDFAEFLNFQLPIISKKFIKNRTLHHILDNIDVPQNSLILEFGVGRGRSIRHIANKFPEHKIFGFDSFIGIPEDFHGGRTFFKKGSFSRNGKLPKVPANVELVTGWFKDTLPNFLNTHHQPISIIHIDCDLYSSTLDVLNTVKKQCTKDTILIFDEFLSYTHEARALYDFIKKYKLQAEWVAFGYSVGAETDFLHATSISQAIGCLKTKVFCRVYHNAPSRKSAVAAKLIGLPAADK